MAEAQVGRRAGRLEGFEKATGRAKYAADYFMPGMLYVSLVRAAIPHGELISIDTSRAPPGVFIFTAQDIPVNFIEDVITDQPVLVQDRIRFLGEPVAIAAAETQQAADDAANLIKLECRSLPLVGDPQSALMNEAPLLHEGGNLLLSLSKEKGDVKQGFAEADLILEDDFFTPVQDHACMEPEASFSFIAEDGCLTSFCATQNVFHDQRMICHALGLAPEQVRVKAAMVGGGFGGKDGHTTQIFTALTAWRTGRPARLVFSRRESLIGTYKRHSASMHVKMGFSGDGRICAFEGSGLLDTGAYAGLGPAVLELFVEHFAGPYKVPNVKIDARLLYTNKAPAHAMRGFGAPQGAFATESLINRAAAALGIDELNIRLINALEYGDTGSLGQVMDHSVGLKEALHLVENSKLWRGRKTNADPFTGFGLACGFLSCGLGKGVPDSAKVALEAREDGSFLIRIGLVDIGQGSGTALRAIAADALGTEPEKIILKMADTACTFDCGSTAASRSTFIAGNALLQAVEKYKAEKKLNPCCTGALGEADFPVSAMASSMMGFPHLMYSFLVQAVKLRVDPLTGKVFLLDIFAATEAGRVVNPLGLDGQIQGGIAMSIGYALGENCIFEEGRLINPDFSLYLLPTALDVPHIENAAVDIYESSGPMGVKGAAELATVAIAPAIGAAISKAAGLSLNRLPFDTEQIFRGIQKRSGL
jgi:CO/xanthine dehydrogenase Mo-binding subunit